MRSRTQSKTGKRNSSTKPFEYGTLESRQLMTADLIGTSLDAPENLKWGETVQVSGSVKNIGNSSAGASYAKVFLSNNSFISEYGRFLGYQ